MKPASLGEQLREWRVRRRMSQMDLALDSEISTRHLSFIETGRSKPSASMLQRIADCLEMPHRASNALLLAGGQPGSYGVEEEKGIREVFEPLGITWEVTETTLDQAEVITRMSDYLNANRGKIKAIIGLGDLATGSIKRVFDQVGVKPGEIPVVGWGNSLDTTSEVLEGYVNAAQWQDPQATSYMCLSALLMETSGIPIGFDVITGALYEAEQAALYHGIMGGN